MHGGEFFLQAFFYLAAAVISVPVAKRLGFGSVLGYLVAGVAVGPAGLQLIGSEGEDILHFAEFGVVMMLFLVGLELQPSRLWRLRGPILGVGGLQVGLTALVFTGIALGTGLPWQMALAIGLTLALSSTAMVLQTLAEKGLLRTDGGQNSFAVLLFQDIAVIPMLAALPLLATLETVDAEVEHGPAWFEALPGWGQTGVVLGAIVAVVVAGRFLTRPLFRFIARTHLREMFTAAALLLVIGAALLMSAVGLSAALGTFLAGVVLANSEYRHELAADIEPFKGLLLGLFFIAVGASIDFALVAGQPGTVGALVGVLVGVKLLILLVIGRVFRMGLDQSLLFALGLSQTGEFAFVLFSFATQNGVLSPEVTDPLVAVVALSMVTTPLLLLFNDRVLRPRVGTRRREARPADAINEENPVIIAGFGRFGGIVGRLLQANGVGTTVLDLDSDHVDLLRRLGFKVFYGDASRRDLLAEAGAGQAKALVIAVDEPEKVLELVETAQRHFPHLVILARASSRSDAYDLLEAGVDHVYRETLETALRTGTDALRLLGFRAHQAHRAARTFLRHDEGALRELARSRHDEVAYLNRSRQSIHDLEQLLLSELEAPVDLSVDAAWDSASRRDEFGDA